MLLQIPMQTILTLLESTIMQVQQVENQFKLLDVTLLQQPEVFLQVGKLTRLQQLLH